MPILRTSLLHHAPCTTADRKSPESLIPCHFDWLVELEPTQTPQRDVMTWRTLIRPDLMPVGAQTLITPIGKHHGRWLTITDSEHLSNHRGIVTPRRQGTLLKAQRPDSSILDIAMDWNFDAPYHYRIEHSSKTHTTLHRVTPESSS